MGVLQNLGSRADRVLIGGKMAAEIAERSPLVGVDVLLPVDAVAADSFDPDADTQVVLADQVPEGWLSLDIGPRAREEFAAAIQDYKREE